ncbi:Sensor protein ZraS [Fundidesulfovibrio magnetotacticus]|uniref:histidine kinase n=1 Tax=Fundidesulfovibrio magnetotacticus TaxID=2730080 RepID=A0A6V8LHK9_9BACT|nr:ATP-binding protein [Fundidesulfovibrio magnetotacticus]GFK92192.1 Sensor protein ZraS [Fundidesulfovibrio magnetotacticus]
MSRVRPSVEDLIGIEHCKLGFYQELRQKLVELQVANLESEERRREIAAILDGITDIMMVLSEDLRIMSVNHVFEEVMGIDDAQGRYCYEVFRQEQRPCPECPAHRSFVTGDVCRETAIFRVGGRNRQFEMVASPINDQGKDERRILIFKRDVTMEKEYQAKFYQAEKMATVGMLAAGVAHEVNNPLASISGFAEGIKRRLGRLEATAGPDLDDIHDYVDTILKECSRCRDIVHTLLTFSRPVSSGFRPVSLNAVVEDTLKLLRSHIKQKNLRLNMVLELSDELPLIYGDEPQLKQVLLNLLINAIDAVDQTGAGQGVITIRTYPEAEEGAGLVVSDTGCGIPKENLDKLFEPFFTTKPVGKGIGIGLSTCYGIVSEHCGEIIVHSESGRGSRFIVRLPSNQGS